MRVKHYNILSFLLLLMFSYNLSAQVIKKTIGNYSTELQSKEIKGKSYRTKISYFPNTGALMIDDDIAAIHYNDLKTDTTSQLKDKIIPFKFQTTLQNNLSQIFKENKNSNLIRVQGTITLNSITKDCIAYFAPIILNSGTNDIYLDFEMKFDLSDFDINEPALLLKGLIEFEIEDGYVERFE